MLCRAPDGQSLPVPDVSLECTYQASTGATNASLYCCPCDAYLDRCVDIDRSMYDTSCNDDLDCMEIASGKQCGDTCVDNAAVNVSGSARYIAAISQLPAEVCLSSADCGPACRNGQCTTCCSGGAGPPTCE
jgi:hypothetical protein